MENFFYDGEFYSDLESFIYQISEEEDLSDIEDGQVWNCTGAVLEPIVKLSASWICEHIPDDRWPDEFDSIHDQVYDLLVKKIDFDNINPFIPKLYYENRKDKFTITKQDLLDYIK